MSLKIAKNCITGKMKLKESLALIENVQSKEQLCGYGGEAASIYFAVFDELILQQKKQFRFQGRSKRPPMDSVNAMLSFVYTLLTNHITSALEVVGLDPYVGIEKCIKRIRILAYNFRCIRGVFIFL